MAGAAAWCKAASYRLRARNVPPRSPLERGTVRGVEIGKACHCGVELQFDRARWAVALLADDPFGFAFDAVAFGEPLVEFLAVRFHRLAHLVIIFFAEHEQHDVGVLLDRA